MVQGQGTLARLNLCMIILLAVSLFPLSDAQNICLRKSSITLTGLNKHCPEGYGVASEGCCYKCKTCKPGWELRHYKANTCFHRRPECVPCKDGYYSNWRVKTDRCRADRNCSMTNQVTLSGTHSKVKPSKCGGCISDRFIPYRNDLSIGCVPKDNFQSEPKHMILRNMTTTIMSTSSTMGLNGTESSEKSEEHIGHQSQNLSADQPTSHVGIVFVFLLVITTAIFTCIALLVILHLRKGLENQAGGDMANSSSSLPLQAPGRPKGLQEEHKLLINGESEGSKTEAIPFNTSVPRNGMGVPSVNLEDLRSMEAGVQSGHYSSNQLANNPEVPACVEIGPEPSRIRSEVHQPADQHDHNTEDTDEVAAGMEIGPEPSAAGINTREQRRELHQPDNSTNALKERPADELCHVAGVDGILSQKSPKSITTLSEQDYKSCYSMPSSGSNHSGYNGDCDTSSTQSGEEFQRSLDLPRPDCYAGFNGMMNPIEEHQARDANLHYIHAEVHNSTTVAPMTENQNELRVPSSDTGPMCENGKNNELSDKDKLRRRASDSSCDSMVTHPPLGRPEPMPADVDNHAHLLQNITEQHVTLAISCLNPESYCRLFHHLDNTNANMKGNRREHFACHMGMDHAQAGSYSTAAMMWQDLCQQQKTVGDIMNVLQKMQLNWALKDFCDDVVKHNPV